MAIKARKVIGIDGTPAQGIKVTQHNVVEVSSWIRQNDVYAVTVLESRVRKDEVVSLDRVRLSTPKGTRVAKIGDVVVRLVGEKPLKLKAFYVIKAADFAGYVK